MYIQKLKETLEMYTIFYEVVPHEGVLDPGKMEITVNPMFGREVEVLMHELLHHFRPEEKNDTVIKEMAREIIKDVEISDFLRTYCKQYAKIKRGRNLFSMVG